MQLTAETGAAGSASTSSTPSSSRQQHPQQHLRSSPNGGTTVPAMDTFEAPLRTSGRYILDARGRRFKLAAVNWYGGSDEKYIPSGLDIQHRSAIANLLKSMGFNTVRMPYSDEMVMKDPAIANGLLSANPDLIGKRALDIFEACVTALTDAGLAVVVNDHITNARWCDGKSLCDAAWKNDHLAPFCSVRLTEEQWMKNWETIMSRFTNNPRVIGCDLRNEVRGIWGTMNWEMWATAAEKCSKRLHKINPAWLMIVEGISSANDVSGARNRPIVLDVPDRVVYSVHVFAWSGWGSMDPYSRRAYPGFVLAMMRNWGWLLKENIAPVWIGEMGASAFPGKGESHYWRNLMQFCEEVDVDFGYWAVNPRKPHENEKETWALVDDGWSQVVDDYRLVGMRRLMKSLGQICAQPYKEPDGRSKTPKVARQSGLAGAATQMSFLQKQVRNKIDSDHAASRQFHSQCSVSVSGTQAPWNIHNFQRTAEAHALAAGPPSDLLNWRFSGRRVMECEAQGVE